MKFGFLDRYQSEATIHCPSFPVTCARVQWPTVIDMGHESNAFPSIIIQVPITGVSSWGLVYKGIG